jgi:probable HAF family extracellular repeat protein
MRGTSLGAVAGASIAAAAGSAHGQQIIDLGVLPGMDASSAAGVSADGTTVAGTSSPAGVSAGAAFRWTAAGGLQNLGTFPGASSAIAWGISADGSAVVGWGNIFPNGNHAFRWTAADGMVDLTPTPASTRSVATGVSAGGTVVAGYIANPYGSSVRWTGSNVFEYLNAAGGESDALDISADGAVIVGSTGFQWRAFRWTAASGMQELGLLPGWGAATARRASADGSVVVGFAELETTGRAFLWRAGVLEELPAPPGTVTTFPQAISADGLSVTGSADFGNGVSRAFLWTRPLGVVDLNLYLPTQGVNLSGWVLTEATGVSRDGRTIAGSGTHSGASRAFVARLGALPCDANCDGSTAAPVLNVSDFACFLNRFFAGDPYANCDGSTVGPVLNVSDFACFLNRFAAGCS